MRVIWHTFASPSYAVQYGAKKSRGAENATKSHTFHTTVNLYLPPQKWSIVGLFVEIS